MTEPSSLRVSSSTGVYPLHFSPVSEVPELLKDAGMRPGKCIVCTDTNVQVHYLQPLVDVLETSGWSVKPLIIPAGEKAKSHDELTRFYGKALSWQIDRQTPLLALGGGVVGDLGGFAAATLLRGIPLVHLPTSLLAQVDSSIGGKTGINHATGKNLIGAFYPPAFICSDLSTLETLPQLEWTSGLAEVVKHACIRDRGFLQWLLTHWNAVLDRQPEVIRPMVRRAAQIKIEVVERDEHERGERALLNFGHTFGHAIEQVSGYGTFTHGEAVALGMRAALHLSERHHPGADFSEAKALVERLPVRHSVDNLDVQQVIDVMYSDKKTQDSTLHFVLLREPGSAYLRGDLSLELLGEAWESISGRNLVSRSSSS